MTPKIAVAPARPLSTERFVPGIHSVQGINSSIDDIRVQGAKLQAMIGDAVAEVTLRRKIVGASSLQIDLLDPSPSRRVLRSRLFAESNELVMDGLRWKLVKVTNQGWAEPISCTYEPLVVYHLKQLMGPHKAFRGRMTRAEFAQARAFEARPRPRFISPELHVVQDIGSAKEAKDRQKEAKEERNKGIGENPDLKVNTRPATKAQVDVIDRMLRVAQHESASTVVCVALIAAVIDESVAGQLSSNLLELIPSTQAGSGIDPTSPEQVAKGFLRGYLPGETGAIEYAKHHPDAKFYEIAQAVQKSGAGSASNGAANYGKFGDEARAWVSSYGGGSDVGVVEFERYAFEQDKKESNWQIMVKLANEVHWRCFESAAWIYFLDEPTLMRSPRRMLVSDIAPGVLDTTFDYDVGKEVTEVVVTAIATNWGAPPGSIAAVSRHGPADGLYVVEEIEAKPSGRKGEVTVTLRRPTEPLPEPLPERKSSSVGFGGSASSMEGVPAKVAQIIERIDEFDAAHTKYLWGGGHGSFASPSDRVDCSGFVSSAVHAAGFLDAPLSSAEFANAFPGGKGDWVTIYGDAQHVVIAVKYPDGHIRVAETSHSNPQGGPGWVDEATGQSAIREHGSNPCHPPGL